MTYIDGLGVKHNKTFEEYIHYYMKQHGLYFKPNRAIEEPENKFGIIYMSIDTNNPKSMYIGQTTTALKKRFSGHKTDIGLFDPIYKQRPNTFITVVIDYAESKEELDNLEEDYIGKYKTASNINPNGLNKKFSISKQFSDSKIITKKHKDISIEQQPKRKLEKMSGQQKQQKDIEITFPPKYQQAVDEREFVVVANFSNHPFSIGSKVKLVEEMGSGILKVMNTHTQYVVMSDELKATGQHELNANEKIESYNQIADNYNKEIDKKADLAWENFFKKELNVVG